MTEPLDRVGLEEMDMGSWGLTALQTIVLHIKRATPESNSSIMTPQNYANLVSLYLAGLANEPSPGKGSEIISALEDALRGTDSTLQAYQNEDGLTFYRVIPAGGKDHRKTQS